MTQQLAQRGGMAPTAQSAFSKLSNDCEDVLIAETGLHPEQLLQEAQRAA
jgi:hypothetical protein